MDLHNKLRIKIEQALNINLNSLTRGFCEEGLCGYVTDPLNPTEKLGVATFRTAEGGYGATIRPYSGSGTQQRTFIENPNSSDKLKLTQKEINEFNQKAQQRRLDQEKANKIKAIERLKTEELVGKELKEFPVLHELEDSELYLKNKQIKPIGIKLGSDPWGRGPCLIVPAQNAEGEKKSYQLIYEDGRKRPRIGTSLKGLFFIFGKIDPENPHDIWLVEGYATGNTCYEAFYRQKTIVVCFTANNLPVIAEILKEKYPNHRIKGLSDLDIWKNQRGITSFTGYKKMYEAMKITGEYMLLPDIEHPNVKKFFKKELVPKGEKGITDYNDLYIVAGMDEVRRQLNEEIKIYPNKPIEFVSSVEASLKIRQISDSFFHNGQYENTTKIVIAGAGTGKSTTANKSYAEFLHEKPKTSAMFFVPTHQKAAETQEDLKKLGVDSIHIKGRNEDSCPMYPAIQKIEGLGGEKMIHQLFCQSGENQCIHYEGCKHLDQFKIPHQAIVYVHAHLTIGHNRLEEKLFFNNKQPDYIVIDERCNHIFERASSVNRADFLACDAIPQKLKEIILSSLDFEDKPLLKLLREAGFSFEKMEEIIKKVPPSMPSFKDIKPGQTLKTLMVKLDAKKKTPNLKRPLILIAEELKECKRDQCVRVHLFEDRIISNWFVPFTRHKRNKIKNPHINIDYIPVLILDADAEKSIIEKILEINDLDIPEYPIVVDRNAHIIQLKSSSVSNQTIEMQIKTGQRSYLDDIYSIVEKEAEQGSRSLIIGPQKITGNENQNIPPHEKIAILHELDATFAHNGALLGRNDLQNNEVGIIVGRNQPPLYAIENSARAIFGLEKDPIRLGSAKVPRAYNMRDGSHQWADVWEMVDPRCQLIMALHREKQIVQAADRLRMVHNKNQKWVYLITNIPCRNIIVDELVTTQQLRGDKAPQRKMEIIKERFFGRGKANVMPLTPAILLRSLRDLFSNEQVLKNWVLRNSVPRIIEYLEQDMPSSLEMVSYRVKGESGKSKRCITAFDDHTKTLEELQAIYGSDKVVIEGIIDGKTVIPIFVEHFWDLTLETGEQVLERIAESVENGTNWMKSMFHTVGTILSRRKDPPSAFDAWMVVKECIP